MDKEFFNTEELFNLVLWVIKNDPSEEVKSLSISLLTDIILDKDKAFELFEIISRESTEFNEIEKEFKKNSEINDIKKNIGENDNDICKCS